MIDDIRENDKDNHKNLDVHGFDFKDPGRAKRIKVLNPTQYLWGRYCIEKLRKIIIL